MVIHTFEDNRHAEPTLSLHRSIDYYGARSWITDEDITWWQSCNRPQTYNAKPSYIIFPFKYLGNNRSRVVYKTLVFRQEEIFHYAF